MLDRMGSAALGQTVSDGPRRRVTGQWPNIWFRNRQTRSNSYPFVRSGGKETDSYNCCILKVISFIGSYGSGIVLLMSSSALVWNPNLPI